MESFSECNTYQNEHDELKLGIYVEACGRIQYGLCQLGPVFAFASSDLTDKVSRLREASQQFPQLTVYSAIENDLKEKRATAGNSNSRNLHRVTNAVKFIRILLESLLENSEQSLKSAATKAFQGSIEYYLAWAPKQAVKAGLYLLPSKEKFLEKIGESEDSARELGGKFVEVTGPLLANIYQIYGDFKIDL